MQLSDVTQILHLHFVLSSVSCYLFSLVETDLS